MPQLNFFAEIPRRSSKNGSDTGGENAALVVEDDTKSDYKNGVSCADAVWDEAFPCNTFCFFIVARNDIVAKRQMISRSNLHSFMISESCSSFCNFSEICHIFYDLLNDLSAKFVIL